MSQIPSKEEFEITLAAIAEREKGTFELQEEAKILEPDYDAIYAFLKKKLKLSRQKQRAVAASAIPKWLKTQELYQKGLKRAFKSQKRKQSDHEWLDANAKHYLNQYEPVTESYYRHYHFDPEVWNEDRVSEYLDDYNAETKRRNRFNDFVVGALQGNRHRWDSIFIRAVFTYLYEPLTIISRRRSHNELDKELAATELLIDFVNSSKNVVFTHNLIKYGPVLHEFKAKLQGEINFNQEFPIYIKSGDETSPERELLLEIWLWFDAKNIKVSAQTLRELLSLDGIEAALPSERSIARNLNNWQQEMKH